MKLSDLELLDPGELTAVPVEEDIHDVFQRMIEESAEAALHSAGWMKADDSAPPEVLCEFCCPYRNPKYRVVEVPHLSEFLPDYREMRNLWWRLTGIGRMQLEGEL